LSNQRIGKRDKKKAARGTSSKVVEKKKSDHFPKEKILGPNSIKSTCINF